MIFNSYDDWRIREFDLSESDSLIFVIEYTTDPSIFITSLFMLDENEEPNIDQFFSQLNGIDLFEQQIHDHSHEFVKGFLKNIYEKENKQ